MTARLLGALLAAGLLQPGVRSQETEGGPSAYEHAKAALIEATGHQGAGRITDAESVLTTAIDVLDVDDDMSAALLIRRADCRRYLGNYAGALSDLDRAEAKAAGSERYADTFRCEIEGIRGDVAMFQGLLGLAARHYTASLELSDTLDRSQRTPWEWLMARRRIARLWLTREDYETLDSRVPLFLEDPAYENPAFAGPRADLLRILGYGLCELEERDPDRPKRARDLLVESLPGTSTTDRVSILGRLAELALKADRPGEAREWLADAAPLVAPPDQGGVDVLALDRLRYDWLLACVERLDGASPDVLLECEQRLTRDLEAFGASWLEQPLRAGGYGPLRYGPVQGALCELVEFVVSRAESDEQRVAAALDAVNQLTCIGTLARSLDAHPSSLDEVRRSLIDGRPDHGILVYLTGPWASHLFVVEETGAHHVRLPREDVIRQQRDRLVRETAIARGVPPAPLLDDLGSLMLPASAWSIVSRWRRVSVTGLDLLKDVPFESLRVAGSVPFGEMFAIDRLPSLPVGVALARRAAHIPSELLPDQELPTVLFVAATIPSDAARALSPGLADLPVSEEDVARLLDPYPRGSTVAFLGVDATFGRLATPLSTNGVFQYLGHGVEDFSLESPRLLAFADEDRLDDGLVDSARAGSFGSPPIVILTACGSGSGPDRIGDEGAGEFTGTFLAEGAECVVTCERDLSLAAALELSKAIHQSFADGRSPAEAARDARVVLARSGLVAFAADLRVTGLGQRAPFHARKPGPSALWLIPLTLAPLLMWSWGRRRKRRHPV